MKVLVCVRRLDKGGSEMLECCLAAKLMSLGIDTHLLGQYSPDVFDGRQKEKYWKNRGVSEVYWLKSENTIKAIVYYYNFFSTLKNNNYDAIITTNIGLDVIIGICKYFKNFMHIIAFHDYSYKSRINKVKFLFWSVLTRNANKYYFISKKVQDNINALLKLDPKKGRVIYNSITTFNENLEKYNLRDALKLDHECKIILGVGRITHNKGFDISIDILKHYLTDNNAVYIIMGAPTDDVHYIKQLYEKIDSLRLNDKVFHIGFKNNVIEIMKQADLLLHLARHEGFGLILLEGIVAGLPIVASDTGGIPEVLKDSPYKVFDLKEREKILGEIIYYLDMDKIERVNLTYKAKQVLLYFSEDRRAKEIYQLIRDI